MNKIGYAINHKTVLKLMNICGIKSQVRLRKYLSLIHISEREQKYLTAAELQRLMTTPLHDPKLYHIRDLFLLSLIHI